MSGRDERFAMGVDFGATGVKLARVGADGGIAARGGFATADVVGVEGWLDAVEREAGRLLAEAPSGAGCAGIGVGVPGFVDYANGFVHDLANVTGWTAVPLAESLGERLKMPVKVDNDVNVMAAGECAFGAGSAFQHAVFLTLGTGVGGGLLLNGQLYRGAFSMGGEIGHMSIDMNGVVSAMGRGGVEQYVGNRQIVERTLRELETGRASSILERAGGRPEAVTPKVISEAAAEGDELALEIFDFVADCLATVMASVAYLLQPQAFIIGGGVAGAGAVLFEPLRRHVDERLNRHFAERLEILPAKLGNDAGVIGAASLVLKG
ncbi:MAG: ROK family protein [Lentisphaerae bacterium]|jgi:glucokinase|nr:ROK family protein [Lentisphaerota bacterium]